MINWRNRLLAVTAGAISMTVLYSCAVTGVGVEGGDVGVGYAAGYYEPFGYDYGGWSRGYGVAPGRGFDHRDDHRDDHGYDHGYDHRDDHRGGGRAPAYRPAPAGRPAPSLPHGSRGRR